MSQYILTGKYIGKTLVGRIIDMGISPMYAAFNKVTLSPDVETEANGVVDSLRVMLSSENFIKPYSEESILSKAF